MTKAAVVATTRHGRRMTVLAAFERAHFRAPIAVESIVDTVAVELWSEDLMSGARALTASGHSVMVAVDGQDRPTRVRHH